MTVALQDLKDYMGAGSNTDRDALIQACLDDAAVLVDAFVGTATVPEGILDRAYLMVGQDLYERRNAPNGIVSTQFGSPDGIGSVGMRVAKDPLNSVYEMLRRWVGYF